MLDTLTLRKICLNASIHNLFPLSLPDRDFYWSQLRQIKQKESKNKMQMRRIWGNKRWYLILDNESTWSTETSGTIDLAILRHNPHDGSPQLYDCLNLKHRIHDRFEYNALASSAAVIQGVISGCCVKTTAIRGMLKARILSR